MKLLHQVLHQGSFPSSAVLFALLGTLPSACGSEGDRDDAAGGSSGVAGGSGGTSGGTGGSSSAGGDTGEENPSIVGGRGGSSGAAAGSSAGGSTNGSGGDTAGSGGNAADAGGNPGDAGADSGGSGGGTGGSGGGEDSIESCFAGLRALEGSSQISTRENAGEQIRLRLALETADRLGTSGTVPWGPVRLALEIDGAVICLDEAELAGTYDGSLHNCDDSSSFERAGQRYEMSQPDTPTSGSGGTLTVFSGTTVIRGPVTLTTTACVQGGGVSVECRSGGPC